MVGECSEGGDAVVAGEDEAARSMELGLYTPLPSGKLDGLVGRASPMAW
jgi:hypothetical protein